MKRTTFNLLLTAAVLVPAAALAADAREEILPANRGVAIEPAHRGQVISNSNRSFRFNQADIAWVVTEPPRMKVLLPSEEQAIYEARQRSAEEAKAAEGELELAPRRVTPLASVYFPFDSSRPLDLGPMLGLVPQLKLGDSLLKLTGYADQKGSDVYNLTLSTRRAAAVGRSLSRAGIANDRIAIEGRGKADPADTDPAKDRRVDLTVMGGDR